MALFSLDPERQWIHTLTHLGKVCEQKLAGVSQRRSQGLES